MKRFKVGDKVKLNQEYYLKNKDLTAYENPTKSKEIG